MTEHVPVANSVRVVPETVHMAVVPDAKLTGSPELAVAASVIGTTLKPRLLSAGRTKSSVESRTES